MIFVDEIDTTLRLDFTDDFFTAIRFLYQLRAAEPTLQRLSFVLIGVATPGDLIKDVARTPFNIGHRIELTDFTARRSPALTTHLPVPEPLDRDLVAWTMRWTGGHPYLTLRTIRSLAESPPPELDGRGRRRACARALLSRGRRDRQQPAVRPRHAHEKGVRPRGGAADVRARPPRRAGARPGAGSGHVLAEALGRRLPARGLARASAMPSTKRCSTNAGCANTCA